MILESILPVPPQHQPLAPIILPQTLATLMHTSRAPGHLSLVCENISINETSGLFFFERLQYSQPSIYVGYTSTDSTNLRAKWWLRGKKICPAVQEMQEPWVQSLDWKDPLEKEMATHSNILAWKISWTEEPGRLQSMGSQRVGND